MMEPAGCAALALWVLWAVWLDPVAAADEGFVYAGIGICVAAKRDEEVAA